MDESCVTVAEIYEMFPNFSKKAINAIHHPTSKKALLDISAKKIHLLQQQKMNSIPIKLKVDEDDLFDDALMLYKAIAFDPMRPLHISLLNQSAFDTGGIRRQFFTDVLDQFVFKDPHSMFQGNSNDG